MSSNSYTFKGTPGIWEVHDDHPLGSVFHVGGPNYAGYNEIAIVVRIRDSIEEKSNAQLIAAAPELFEALQTMLQSHKTSGMSNGAIRNAEEQAHAALAKATGEGNE